tara:strand:- start:194849 stop:195088 length:240 start_codon:yes stop_codon:yes gene_type:complete
MSHTPHELRDDFPEYIDKIHDLKINDKHFARLFDEYHEINRHVHRLEIGEDHASQTDEEMVRKKRMQLKDQLYALLTSA